MPATTTLHSNAAHDAPIPHDEGTRASAEPGYRLIRRNGKVTPFDPTKITVALTKAFLAVEGSTAAGSRRVHDVVAELTEQVVTALTRRVGEGRTFHIEDVQDQVELALMRSEHHRVARAYVLYREERARERAAAKAGSADQAAPAPRTARFPRSIRRGWRRWSMKPAMGWRRSRPKPSSPRPSAIFMTAFHSTNCRWRRFWRRALWSSRNRTTPSSLPACCSTGCAARR
jgi:hypothetical protein